MVEGATALAVLRRSRSLLLVLLSLMVLPLSILITAGFLTYRWTRQIAGRRRPEILQDETPKRVLVTGIGMAKGLFLARTMYLGGCTVIGADFDSHGNLHCGRFSRAVHKFYALKRPARGEVDLYIAQVMDLIRQERIELWISCSGVATAIEDAQLAQAIEQSTPCKVFQLNQLAVSILDNKMSFMKETAELGLNNLEWHTLKCRADVGDFLQGIQRRKSGRDTKYIIKSASMDDATRGALPILDTARIDDMQSILSSLKFSEGNTWIVQEFIQSGEEFCTQAVVVNGHVAAFTACRSESVLMHYQQLDPQSILFKQMLHFTREYISGLSKRAGLLTGHISFDFLVRHDEAECGFTGVLAPIECNPRCHTATVMFRGLERQLAARYLSILQPQNILPPLIGGPTTDTGYYWMSHDLVILCVLPLLKAFQNPSLSRFAHSFKLLADGILHLFTWTDPALEWWDPVPWLILNHLYWPIELTMAGWYNSNWKQINVSTGKIFAG